MTIPDRGMITNGVGGGEDTQRGTKKERRAALQRTRYPLLQSGSNSGFIEKIFMKTESL